MWIQTTVFVLSVDILWALHRFCHVIIITERRAFGNQKITILLYAQILVYGSISLEWGDRIVEISSYQLIWYRRRSNFVYAQTSNCSIKNMIFLFAAFFSVLSFNSILWSFYSVQWWIQIAMERIFRRITWWVSILLHVCLAVSIRRRSSEECVKERKMGRTHERHRQLTALILMTIFALAWKITNNYVNSQLQSLSHESREDT